MIYIFIFLLFENAFCNLWSKGVVHYSVNPKDYDPHSQDVIVSTLQKIQNEICVKFFSIPVNYTAEKGEKILHIHNPNRMKTCSPQNYDFSSTIIDMPVGYKCLNERDITKLVVDMLKATIHKSRTIINSEDLMQKFEEKDRLENPEKITLLSPNDRNYINAHYFQECGGLTQRSAPSRRNDEEDGSDYSPTNRQYYREKAWPLGIVVYDVNETTRLNPNFAKLLAAMSLIELDTCILFQEGIDNDGVLSTKHKVVFSDDGEDWPHLGFREGVQTLKLESIVGRSAPGHTSHTLMMLMRILGIPMMSNRYDRDNYVRVHWKNVKKGSELYLEKAPEEAWLKQVPYDFNSASHAPATFLCPGCLTSYTVEPIQDHLWHRTLTMGRTGRLSGADVKTITSIYMEQCQNRVLPLAKDRVALAGVAPGGQPLASSDEKKDSPGSDAEDQASDQGKSQALSLGKDQDSSDTDSGSNVVVISPGNGTLSKQEDSHSDRGGPMKLWYKHGKHGLGQKYP